MIYADTAIEAVSGNRVTRFFHIRKDSTPQYFQCEHTGETVTLAVVQKEVDEIIDRELTAEIEKHL